MRTVKILIAIAAAFTMSLGVMNAQKKAVGLTFSLSSIGLSYEHYVESDSFITVDLSAETDDYMWMRASHIGVTADLVWNMVFAERTTSLGNNVSFFAGPGVMAGYVTDLKDLAGPAFGLKGRIGMECRFNRPITLSATLSPVLGAHITYQKGEVKMRLYKSGLMQIIIPEIGIKYAF